MANSMHRGRQKRMRLEPSVGTTSGSIEGQAMPGGRSARLTNHDILGDEILQNQADHFRKSCYGLLGMNSGQSRGARFPGSHPVSLNAENLELLKQRYYYATWKADGTGYMMVVTVDECYLIDRSFNFRKVQMRFPLSSDHGYGDSTHHHTLLEGKMVIDTLQDTKKQERRYLVYDLMAINGVSVLERPFHEPWRMIDKQVIAPRNNERKNFLRSRNPCYRYDLEPFRVRRKDFWSLLATNNLLKGFIPSLPHAADGFILQGWSDPCVPRTHEGLLKWKYPDMNSVDFLFEIDNGGGERLLFLHDRGKKKLVEINGVVFDNNLNPSSSSGKIIECSWHSDKREWVCLKPRFDKSTLSEISTYQKVMRSIKDNITEDVLLMEISEIIQLPIYSDRTTRMMHQT